MSKMSQFLDYVDRMPMGVWFEVKNQAHKEAIIKLIDAGYDLYLSTDYKRYLKSSNKLIR